MSASSGGPTRRIKQVDPPLSEDDDQGSRRFQRAETDKAEWHEQLPQWLRESEPEKKFSTQWGHWFTYARTGRYKSSSSAPSFIDYEKAASANWDFVRSVRQESMTTVCVPSASGGIAKSTTASLLSAYLRQSTDMPVLLYDGDTSDPNLLKFFHLDDPQQLSHTFTGHELVEILKVELLSYEDYVNKNHQRYAAFDEDSGVAIIHAKKDFGLDFESSARIVTKGKKAFHTLIADTQPGTGADRTDTNGLVHASDIIIVPGRADAAKTLDAVSTTLDYDDYGLRDPDRKGKNVIIAIGSVSPADFNRRVLLRFADRFKIPASRVVLIPNSEYIRSDRSVGDVTEQKVNKIKLSGLDKPTLYGVSELARAVTKMAIRINLEKSQVDTPPSPQLFQFTDWRPVNQQAPTS